MGKRCTQPTFRDGSLPSRPRLTFSPEGLSSNHLGSIFRGLPGFLRSLGCGCICTDISVLLAITLCQMITLTIIIDVCSFCKSSHSSISIIIYAQVILILLIYASLDSLYVLTLDSLYALILQTLFLKTSLISIYGYSLIVYRAVKYLYLYLPAQVTPVRCDKLVSCPQNLVPNETCSNEAC